MLGLTFSSKFDWDSYIISIAKTTSKKIGILIRCVKVLSPEVALYLYKSTIWNSVVMSGLVLLVATWNCWISYKNRCARLLVLHLLPLLNHWLIMEIKVTLKPKIASCSSEQAELVPLLYSQGRSSCYSDRLHDFSVTISRC